MIVLEIVEKQVVKTVRYIEYNGYRFYSDKRGYWIGQVEDGRFVRLHIYVWENEVGEIPDGYHIHHKDFNPDNNDISNLQLMPKHEHLKYHSNLQDKEWARRNLEERARPKAKEWHGSEAGIEWHRKHGKEVAEKLKLATVELVCQHCGKTYSVQRSISEGSRFCSNACKSAWRRKVGLDDEERVCAICGKKFFANKYANKKTCSHSCHEVLAKQIVEERRKKKLESRENIVSNT